MVNELFDLYLWTIPNSDILYVVRNLSLRQGSMYAQQWMDSTSMHDYMLVGNKSNVSGYVKDCKVIEKDASWLLNGGYSDGSN